MSFRCGFGGSDFQSTVSNVSVPRETSHQGTLQHAACSNTYFVRFPFSVKSLVSVSNFFRQPLAQLHDNLAENSSSSNHDQPPILPFNSIPQPGS